VVVQLQNQTIFNSKCVQNVSHTFVVVKCVSTLPHSECAAYQNSCNKSGIKKKTVHRKESLLSKESDSKILQSIYFAY